MVPESTRTCPQGSKPFLGRPCPPSRTTASPRPPSVLSFARSFPPFASRRREDIWRNTRRGTSREGQEKSSIQRMARKDSNPQRRWSLSTPTSPLSREDAQVGYAGASSRLAPYHPGSFYAASPTIRPVACRKIRNDISAEEKQEICMAFELFDSRKIGKHNLRDLKVAMRALDFPVKKADCRKLIEEYCKDGSDEVDKDEFMEILTAKYQEKDPDEDLAKAFRFFDEDNTGKISLKNLRKIARDLGEHITDDELAAMIDEFDKDGDGEISETEFLGIMKRDDVDS